MKVESSTAGREEDVRDKTTRLKLTAEDDVERILLADLARAILDNVPITIGEKVYYRERIDSKEAA